MDKQLADRLQKLRKENGYSQEELADALNVSRQAVSKWECGDALPDTENLIALAKLYNCSIDAIVFEKGTDVAQSSADAVPNASEGETLPQAQTEQPDLCAEPNTPCNNEKSKVVGTVSAITVFTCVITYCLLGALLGAWHPAWIVFFAIPLVPSLLEAFIKRNMHIFCFPVLVTAVYLLLGCVWSLWHPWWVVFFLVPIYYTLCNLCHKNESEEDSSNDADSN